MRNESLRLTPGGKHEVTMQYAQACSDHTHLSRLGATSTPHSDKPTMILPRHRPIHLADWRGLQRRARRSDAWHAQLALDPLEQHRIHRHDDR
jgi:hypothetical protein